jgi:exosortase B
MALPQARMHALEIPPPGAWKPWGLMALGLAALYVPGFYDLLTGLWRSDQYAHGPIVLGMAIWLAQRRWSEVMRLPDRPLPALGWPLLVLGLALHMLGRSQDILMFEIGSLMPVSMAVLLLLKGPAALRPMAFAIFFSFFMVPLPGVVVDVLTHPLKMGVSLVAEDALHALGYPMARNGVMLQIGQYQLLVADACAGLNTLFALEAMGLVYLSVVQHESLVRKIILAILIVPISFAANVIRVIVLCLVTYHLGDEAGQGFLHGFAGIVLFVAAIFLMVGADTAVRSVLRLRRRAH